MHVFSYFLKLLLEARLVEIELKRTKAVDT